MKTKGYNMQRNVVAGTLVLYVCIDMKFCDIMNHCNINIHFGLQTTNSLDY